MRLHAISGHGNLTDQGIAWVSQPFLTSLDIACLHRGLTKCKHACRRPPSIYFKKKKTGGMSFNATVPLTRMDEKLCQRILQVNTGPSHPSVLWGMSYML